MCFEHHALILLLNSRFIEEESRNEARKVI